MKIKEFMFPFDQQSIAQRPCKRGKARLLVLHRNGKEKTAHKRFCDLYKYLTKGDVLVLNDSRLIPTRMWCRLDTGGQRELTLVDNIMGKVWSAYIRPEISVKKGSVLIINDGGLKGKVISSNREGIRRIELSICKEAAMRFLQKKASLNLPFYLKSKSFTAEQYNTVYARYYGSCQPPTAGLNFTKELLQRLKKRGVKVRYVTLHVSGSIISGSYRYVRDVSISSEWCKIPKKTAKDINQARREGTKVIAVGTTTARTLESSFDKRGNIVPASGRTELTILPGHRFKVIDGFLTNFHMPGSSHLLMTCAFGGRDMVLGAYKEALKHKYGFLDFGDLMLII